VIDRDTYRVKPSQTVKLSDHDSGHTSGYDDKRSAQSKLEKDIRELASRQDVLNAQARHGILIIFQGMDTAGKDGAIKHVTSGINPQGVNVYAFKQPTDEERRHDYLWRCMKVAPERGRIGIFNRSYYEDVVVPRVHPELLVDVAGKHPSAKFWKRRFEDINAYERHLADNNIRVVKFFLHISREEQRIRLLARLEDPTKLWKFSEGDLHERSYWKSYVKAYEAVFEHTSSAHAPWYVIPSDHKWFTRVAVADILVAELKSLHLEYPPVTKEKRAAVARQKKLLERE
jgi:PPK2 family polyphosphate:nucleotide phosphotransferase